MTETFPCAIATLSDLVMDRFKAGFSMADAIEGVKSGRTDDEDVWALVEKRCESLALERRF